MPIPFQRKSSRERSASVVSRWPRGWLTVLFTFAVTFFSLAPVLVAAPVTLAFEAQIHKVFPGIPFDSGIEFTEGDVISGQFTFEPDDGDGGMSFKGRSSMTSC